MKYTELQKLVKEFNAAGRAASKKPMQQKLDEIGLLLWAQLKDKLDRAEKIKASLAERKRKGLPQGGARRKSGVNMRQLRELRKQGLTHKQIGRVLGISESWVYQLLKRRRAS